MRETDLRSLLTAVASGTLSPEAALERLASLPYVDLGDAKLDLHREIRSGAAEAVLAEGKSLRDLELILDALAAAEGRALVTRVSPAQARHLLDAHPEASWNEKGRVLTLGSAGGDARYRVAVLAAGTSDVPVAEEAAACGEWLGANVERHYDVGIAGAHRLFDRLGDIRRADTIVAVAGMDGALPTLVAGLVRAPVIAVPTSVGYGASFGGLAALLTMLNACSPGVAVVNIDNGYGAAVLAHRICCSQYPREPRAS